MTIRNITLLALIVGTPTINALHKRNCILNEIQKAKYPTLEQRMEQEHEIFQLNSQVHDLLSLDLTEKQRKHLLSLENLNGSERITVTKVVLNQYKNNPEIQKQKRERNQPKNLTSENNQSLFYGINFQHRPNHSAPLSQYPHLLSVETADLFKIWSILDSEQK